ncbi:MAG: hypothetical protein H6661_07140 [Ardenticatenaceae bacterium]|nr:hypothetical protein [Ardenticatenaceae bacterium]
MSDIQKNNPQKNNTSEHEFILPPKKPEAEASPAGDVPTPQPENEPAEDDPSLVKRLTNLTGDVTVGALKLAVKAGSVPVRLGAQIHHHRHRQAGNDGRNRPLPPRCAPVAGLTPSPIWNCAPGPGRQNSELPKRASHSRLS